MGTRYVVRVGGGGNGVDLDGWIFTTIYATDTTVVNNTKLCSCTNLPSMVAAVRIA